MPGILYLVPAALGKAPWERTLPSRVREIACGLDYLIVERAKTARAELARIAYPHPLRSVLVRELPDRPERGVLDELLDPVQSGRSAGLMSEAGCPGVADPGAQLVLRAHDIGVRVAPLVGPSAVLLALMASGLNGQCFSFLGYLPVEPRALETRIRQVERDSRERRCTQLFIETPYRNQSLFRALLHVTRPDTLLCVATNLTTDREQIATSSIEAWKRRDPPRIHRQPTVFLLLAAP
jgi:16S rRNA (cytidine1402-2'-O)-methyltransferase